MVSFCALVEEGDQEVLVEKIEELKESETFKAELNQRNKAGHSALDMAALLGRRPLMDVLLEHGADVNACNKSGYTAMHYSAAWGQLECIQSLVNNGSLLSGITRHHETPRALSLRYGHHQCVHYLDCHDTCVELSDEMKKARFTLTDTEKITGKWNKEDRSKVTGLCNEMSEWLLHNVPEDTSLDRARTQKTNFHTRLQPYFDKLSTTTSRT